MSYTDKYDKWKKTVTDEEIRAELDSMSGSEDEIKSRFSSVLEFGTAGFRSRTGAGTSRINIYTVREASQGVADYMNENCNSSLCVTYDTRHYSKQFAYETALVFAANGIKTYLFEQPTGVPELSFAIRQLGLCGGVAITASHNPKDYNGYKVYASWGGQILGDVAEQISQCIRRITDFDMVKTMSEEEAIIKGLLEFLGSDMDNKYFKYLIESVNDKELVKAYAKEVKLVYTPLFGTGLKAFEGSIKKLGFDVSVIEQQKNPDADFPGIITPNPEDENAMKLAKELAQSVGADIAFGTDPDADRFGVVIPDEKGVFLQLSGNQVGCIITDYLLSQRQRRQELKSSDFIIRSFVSTPMADKIAQSFGVECVVVPTGFKNFSDVVYNKYTDRHFVFGFEESCGYMGGNKVADKDGMLAALWMLEVLCDCKKNKISLYKRLKELYEKYGWYKEKVVSVVFEQDPQKSGEIMAKMRKNPIKEFGGQRVTEAKDYLKQDNQNMLMYTLENGWLAVRPSGTEPKIKLYYGVCEKTNSASQALLERIDESVMKLTSSWKENP